MPELPEVEHLRRTLEPALLGATLLRPRLHRNDVLRINGTRLRLRPDPALRLYGGRLAQHLLGGSTITELLRHGKNLVIVGHTGRVLCVHLGMSGQMRFLTCGQTLRTTSHVHCEWRVVNQAARHNSHMVRWSPSSRTMRRRDHRESDDTIAKTGGRLIFRDPRRFGGLWAYESLEALTRHRFNRLGPDALTITATQLHEALHQANRSIKAVLLDQSRVAGVGNIYADEALFRSEIHPGSIAGRLRPVQVERLADSIRSVLLESIGAGGSTIRDYLAADGSAGTFTAGHMVYGRSDQPCLRCSATLKATVMAQRTTVFCPRCQRKFR